MVSRQAGKRSAFSIQRLSVDFKSFAAFNLLFLVEAATMMLAVDWGLIKRNHNNINKYIKTERERDREKNENCKTTGRVLLNVTESCERATTTTDKIAYA